MVKKIALAAAMAGIFPSLYGQTEIEEQSPFRFEASYLGDFYGNAGGGLKTGAGFMGMANIKVGFDTGNAGWWRGGSFFINGAGIHGKSLSEQYLGDLQVASNIDAGEHAYLHELWFRQQLGGVSLSAGLQDLNVDYMASAGGGEFINSSFGVPAVISTNVPVPIFPLTGLGASVRWDIDGGFAVQAAAFDGDQTPFEHNPHNMHWKFSKEDGMLGMAEFHAKTGIGGRKGVYKLGAYYHSRTRNYGVYILADQNVFEFGQRRLDLFAQLGAAPKGKNGSNYYAGLGANLFGVFSRQGRDALGLAVAHAGFHSIGHRHETALELYYKYRLSDNIAFQPDIQYIVNPSGTDTRLNNALAGIIRLYIDF